MLTWTQGNEAEELLTGPAFTYVQGYDVFLASAFTASEPQYPSGGDHIYIVLPSGRRQPASIVMSWEWQKRVLVPLDHVGEGFNRANPSKSISGVMGTKRQRLKHAMFLKACFVRRQRFEATQGPSAGSRAYKQNLRERQLPGRLVVWFTRSMDVDAMAANLVEADDKEV